MDKRHVGYAVKSLNRSIGRVFDDIPAIRENKNLTSIQFWILAFLFKNADRDLYQKDVEVEFKIRRSTATELMKLMESSGLIRRVPVEHDTRLKKIVTTEYAQNVRKQLDAQVERTQRLLTEGFSEPEIDQFFDFVCRIKENLAKIE